MRALIPSMFLVAIAQALPAVASPTPGPIPSTVSGAYVGEQFVCRLVFSRFGAGHVDMDVRCFDFINGRASQSYSRIWGTLGCPDQTTAIPIDAQAGLSGLFFSIRAIYAGAIDVVVSVGPDGASNGIGSHQTWLLLEPIPSPAAYSCGSGATTKD